MLPLLVVLGWLLCLAAGLRNLPAALAPDAADKVPFYMYELPFWSKSCDRDWMTSQNFYPDVALHRALTHHPWRVISPTAAKLLVVPGYFGLSMKGYCGSHEQNMLNTVAALKKNSFFEGRLRDTLFSCFIYDCEPELLLAFGRYGRQMMAAHFEQDGRWSRTVVVPYGPVMVQGSESYEPPPKNRSLFFMGNADLRHAYRTRRRAIRQLPSHFNNTVLCQVSGWSQGAPVDTWDDPITLKTPIPFCKEYVLETGCFVARSTEKYIRLGGQSQYALVIHGDTPSTSRLYDASQFQQLPIIVSEDFYGRAAPFPQEMAWDQLASYISKEEFAKNAVGTVRRAMASWSSNGTRRELWYRARPLLDWSVSSHCVGTALLTSAARNHLGYASLPGASHRPECTQKAERLLTRTS